MAWLFVVKQWDLINTIGVVLCFSLYLITPGLLYYGFVYANKGSEVRPEWKLDEDD